MTTCPRSCSATYSKLWFCLLRWVQKLHNIRIPCKQWFINFSKCTTAWLLHNACNWKGCGPEKKNKKKTKSSLYTWYTKAKRGSALGVSQYISNRKLFFVVSQTTRAKFFPKMSLTQQNKPIKTGSWVLGNSTQYWVGDPLRSLNHHPTMVLWLFWNVRYSWPRMEQWLLPSCFSQQTEAGWKFTLPTCCEKGLFSV